MRVSIKYCPYCGSKRLEDFLSETTMRGKHCKRCGETFEVMDQIVHDYCSQCGEKIMGKRSFNSVKLANGNVKHNRCRKPKA